MFDVGFSELVLIFVIALIVLGPERLPKVARTAGRWLGRARQMARSMQYELERELDLKEMGLDGRDVSSNVTAHPSYGAPPGQAAGQDEGDGEAQQEPAPAETDEIAAAQTGDPTAGKTTRADGAGG